MFALAGSAFAQVNITTWQVNLQHTGNNASETILTPGNISVPGNFGLLFSQPLDGQTYGQPLLMSGLSVGGTTHNIVYVCTEHCSIYAFDADSNIGPNANPIWHDNLLPAGTVPVPQSVVGSGDISIELGITTTPVIDPATNTIYIVSKVQRTSDTTCHQYLYALDLTTGTTKFNSPVEMTPTFPGSSNDSSGGVIPFSALHEHTRAAMTLYNGIVYISYASHSDTQPYHGEIIGYNATTLQQVPSQTFITTPNGEEGGIWQAGAGPAFDTSGNIFVSIANGAWDQKNPQNGTDWGESMLKISTTSGTGLSVSFSNTLNWFTPNIWNTLNGGDLDLGSGGLCLLPDQAGPHTHIMVGGGKGAVLYVVDRDNLGGIATPDNAIQEISEVGGDWLFVTPAYYNGYIYYSPSGGPLEQRAVGYNATNGSYISTTPVTSTNNYGGKGFGCFISSNGTTNGIVWILTGGGINAYNAANVAGSPIYSANSTLPGNVGTQNTKFSLPMVANGKLYYTAFDSTNTGHLLVSGLVSSGSGTPAAPGNALATANSSSTITVTWTDNSNNETGFSVQRANSAGGPFTQVGTAGANVTTYTDTGLSPGTTYYYLVEAYNGNGASAATNVTSAATFPNYTASGLVAYWNMDETSGATVHDLTGHGNAGTINGEALLATGLINDGVSFHGTGQATANVTVPNNSTMQFAANQSFTLSAWVLPLALRSSEETVIAKSRDQGNNYGIWINAGNQWVFRGPGGDIVGPAVTQGAWTHVAVVQDGVAGTRTLYVNGTAQGTGAAQAGDGAGSLWMAQQNISGNFESFPGTLDEVRLYNRALAATEITNLMSTPVVQVSSVQTQGNAGTFPLVIWPSANQVTEPRKGSTVGNYNLVLNFPAPVSGIAASLGLQGGGAAVGSVGSVSYDSTGEVVTVTLTGVGNDQALDLHLTGVPSGSSAPAGTQDVPFNVLWGDANKDGVVSALDASIVQNGQTAIVNSTSYLYDINCDGAVNSTDVSLVNSYIGTSIGTEAPTNLALFQPMTVSSVYAGHAGNVGANAVDNNLTTRWESAYSDPQWIYVNLGSICTINAVNIAWENAGGSNYLIQVSNDATNWTTVASVTGNTIGSGNGSAWQYNTGLNATGQYVRMYGETRDDGSAYGYSMWEYQVIGTVGTGSSSSAPVITGALTTSGTVGSAFNYQITASNNPTSYTSSALPGGLTLNATGDITGMPTSSGTTGVTISAINSSGTGSATLTIGISAPNPPPAITSATTASGTVGLAFNYQIVATNGATGYSSTTLPGGLNLNAGSGDITGTPQASGTTTVTLTATNPYGSGTSPLTITITPASSIPAITSAAAASGIVGVQFSYQIAATNNPTSFSASGLPGGLSFNSSGLISGTPTASGTTSATIYAINSSGTGSAALTITINPAGSTPPSITSPRVTTATLGVAFNYQIAASNGPASYNAVVLPPGLSINTSTGLITGTPTASGTTNVTISAANASGTGQATLTIIVNTSTDINLALNKPVTVSSYYAPHNNFGSYAVDGNLGSRWESNYSDPQWLYVDLGSVCYIHAVDIDWENAGGSNYLIQVSNDAVNWTTIKTVTGNSASGFLDYTGFNVSGRYVRMYGETRNDGSIYGYSIYEFQVWGVQGPAPAINSGTSAIGTVGSAFGYQIGATNNPFSFTAAGLPAGLGLNGPLISGTPTVSGTTSVPITAINSSGTGGGTVTITINPATASAPVFTNVAMVTGTTGGAVNYTPNASNSPSSYSVAGLPSGLLYSSGTVNGSPNGPGINNVTVSAVNGNGTTQTTVPIVINPGIDTNLAYNQQATASSVNADNDVANYVTDENYTTRWESVWQTDPSWIYVNLGQVDTIHSVVIDWENAAGSNYEIEVSNDAVNWNAVATVTGNTTGGVHTYSGLNATGQYVRMYGTSRVMQAYGYSMYEMQVFGVPGTLPPGPEITSGSTASGIAGNMFSYQILATNNPTGYGASGLPSGLNVNTSTGAITGTPAVTGTTSVTTSVALSATNAGGTGTATLAITVLPPPPSISTQQGTQAVTSGQSATFSINATGSGTLTYQWYKNSAAIPGATSASYTIPETTAGDAATYSVTVTDQYGDTSTSTYTLTVNSPIPALPLLALAAMVLLLFAMATPFLHVKQQKI